MRAFALALSCVVLFGLVPAASAQEPIVIRLDPPAETAAAPAPEAPPAAPGAATALCRDGSLSYSQQASGTCSSHGGVQTWHPVFR